MASDNSSIAIALAVVKGGLKYAKNHCKNLVGDFECLEIHLQNSEREYAILRIALEESIKLQAHYATLLNEYDGGERTVFKVAEEWIRRLQEMNAPIVCRRK